MRKLLGTIFSAALLLIVSAQLTWAQKPNVYELGTYPGGTWLATWGINELGVVVGRGDVPPIDPDSGVGYTHSFAVPLFGPNAGQWIDLGTLGGEQSMGWEEPMIKISNSGLIVSHSTARDGYARGVAWTKESGLVDLGTLADTGNPAYADYKSSWAYATNRLGTLIVGGSAPYGDMNVGFLAPVVWTPSNVWMNGKSVTKWQIHTLDTAEFPDFAWNIWAVNNYGQIVALGWNSDGTINIGALWNPRADGKGWGELTALPPLSGDYPTTCPFDINNMGEIVGIVISADWSIWLPVLWKPLDKTRTTYSQPIVLSLPAGFGFTSGEAVGINEVGDIVGDCWNEDYTVHLPVRWIAEHPTFSEIIKFPGSWGFSWGVNNSGIASVTYGDSKKCPDTYASCGGATMLH